jgi:UTP--glucose-1-phosphate uridylyltransferase
MNTHDLEAVLGADERAELERLGPGLDRLARLREAMLAGRMSAEANRLRDEVTGPAPGDLEAVPSDPAERSELARIGGEALKRGQVALLLLNGGMATRFGGVVKGTVPVVDGRSFLAFKLDDARRVAARYDAPLPAVILMNSRATSEATAAHLREHGWFGYPQDRLWSFEQQWTLRLRPDGSPLLDAEGRPSFYGPGHGDMLPCLRRSGLLDRFLREGGRVLLMSNVDNVVATLDPVLVGWHLRRGVAVTAELADKEPGDAGGMPARVAGRPQIVESFRFPPTVDPEAIPLLNTNTFWFDAPSLDRDVELTWFLVRKQVDGEEAVQFERLVGELTAYLPTAFLRVPRSGPESRFFPVKRPEDLERGREALVAAWTARSGVP